MSATSRKKRKAHPNSNAATGQSVRELQNKVLDEIATDILQKQELGINFNRSEYVRNHQKTFSFVNRDKLNYRIRLLQNKRKANEIESNEPSSALPSNAAGTSSTIDHQNDGVTVPKGKTQGKRGRKKGSTDAAKKEAHDKERKALYWVTVQYKHARDKVKPGGRVAKGLPKSFAEQARAKFDLPQSWEPNFNTIKSRCRTGIWNVDDPRPGHTSPVDPTIEAVVANIAIESNRAGWPLDKVELIDLANSLIKGTEFEQQIIEWQLVNNPSVQGETAEKVKTRPLGNGWYEGFMRRNPQIATGRAMNVDQHRATWCKYGPMSDMYTMTYQRFVDHGHAKKLPEPQWQDLEGNVVSEQEAYGEMVTHVLTHPERIIMFDELGSNTNTTKQKNAGNKKVHCGKGERARRKGNNGDCHFTDLGLTLGTGEPLLNVTIIQKETALTDIEILGRNEFAHWEGDESDIEGNTGPGKILCGGPVVNFRGKLIKPLVLHSSSGGITAEILVEILKYIESLDIFPRGDGLPDPMLLVDGHGSRLSPVFLNYVFGENHKYILTFGLPNGTGYWQVGDSNSQNGNMKAHIVEAKAKLVRKLQSKQKSGVVGREHVMWLVSGGWPKSFGNIEGNKRAIAKRGWGPLNRGCCTHPEILKTKVTCSTTNSSSREESPQAQQEEEQPASGEEFASDDEFPESQDTTSTIRTTSTISSLNYSGFTSDVMGQVLHEYNRTKNQEKELRLRREEQEAQSLDDRILAYTGRLTSGAMYGLGLVGPNETLRQRINDTEQTKIRNQRKKVVRKYQGDKKAYENGLELFQSKKAESKWTMDNYRVAIVFKIIGRKKEKYYSSMPKEKSERKKIWEKVKVLPDPAQPYLEGDFSDSEDESETNNGHGDSEVPPLGPSSSAEICEDDDDPYWKEPSTVPPLEPSSSIGSSAEEYDLDDDDDPYWKD